MSRAIFLNFLLLFSIAMFSLAAVFMVVQGDFNAPHGGSPAPAPFLDPVSTAPASA